MIPKAYPTGTFINTFRFKLKLLAIARVNIIIAIIILVVNAVQSNFLDFKNATLIIELNKHEIANIANQKYLNKSFDISFLAINAADNKVSVIAINIPVIDPIITLMTGLVDLTNFFIAMSSPSDTIYVLSVLNITKKELQC